MIDGPAKQNDGDAPEAPAQKLATPHFDDRAVAIAQAVEPLPPEPLSWSRLASQPLLIVVAFALVFAIVVAGSFLLLHSETTRVAPEATTEQRVPPNEAAELEKMDDGLAPEKTSLPAFVKDDDHPRSRKVGRHSRFRNRIVLTDEDGRPVARKVGEIRYKRGQN